MSDKLRTLVIDDEPIALAKLSGYVSKTPFLELAGECSSGIEALEFLSRNSVDLIFTDINMPDLNGLELARTIGPGPMIVFITAYSEYAVDSYSIDAVDYLLKPYGFPDFLRSANRALERSGRRSTAVSEQAQESDTAAPKTVDSPLFIKVDYKYVKVNPSDIRYIKGYGEYLQIFVSGSDTPLLTLSSFVSIRERLPETFMQIHRSYIVNLQHAVHIEKARVTMDAKTVIPVGDSYKPALNAYLGRNSVGGSQK